MRRLFLANAQDSAELEWRKLFVKDARLRPVWRILLFVVSVPLVATAIWTVYFFAVGGVEHEPSLLSEEITGEAAAAIAALLVSLWLRKFVDRRSIASLGLWTRWPAIRLLLLGIAFGACMQALAFGVEAITKTTRIVGFGPLASEARLLSIAFGVFLAVALFEELSFRGYLFQNFWEGFGLVPAVILTSILFACVHLNNPNAKVQTLQTLAGLVLFAIWACYSVVWTKSLWLALGAHLAWNLFEGPVFGFPVSGVVMPYRSVFIERTSGPDWLTGGAFGPEAGVSSLLALGLGLVVLRLLYLRGAFADSPDVREEYAH
jgi:uncharacterized protein